MTDASDTDVRSPLTSPPDETRRAAPAFLRWVPRLVVLAWSFVGFVVATIIVVVALGAVSEIVLPMTFAGTSGRKWSSTGPKSAGYASAVVQS